MALLSLRFSLCMRVFLCEQRGELLVQGHQDRCKGHCAMAGAEAGQAGAVPLQPLPSEAPHASVIILSPDNTMDVARRLGDESAAGGEKAHAGGSGKGSRGSWPASAKGA
jgi:hypothetical protein